MKRLRALLLSISVATVLSTSPTASATNGYPETTGPITQLEQKYVSEGWVLVQDSLRDTCVKEMPVYFLDKTVGRHMVMKRQASFRNVYGQLYITKKMEEGQWTECVTGTADITVFWTYKPIKKQVDARAPKGVYKSVEYVKVPVDVAREAGK